MENMKTGVSFMQNIDPVYLEETPILDFTSEKISTLIRERKWLDLNEYDKIGAGYDFVRNEIKFGYNRSDNIPASEVLRDGYGQCNTKGTLLMALLRAIGIPCRIHGFTIHKSLQRGVVPELVYPITPDNILHSWVEVYYNGRWVYLEGFILDNDYLSKLKDGFGNSSQSLCAYGVGTEDLSNPEVNWCGENTFIQKTGINSDLGIFKSPDEFYAVHHQKFSFWKRLLYQNVVRHWMNARVEKMRKGKLLPKKLKSSLDKDQWKHALKDSLLSTNKSS